MTNYFDEVLGRHRTHRTVTLQENRLKSRAVVEDFEFANLDIQYLQDRILNRSILELKARVAGNDIKTVVKYPSDWKQAFKERWFPVWLLNKYPVEYTTYDAKILYPTISIPDHQYYVQLVISED